MSDDLVTRHHDAALDAAMTETLVGGGLAVRRVDDAVRTETEAWQDAVARGFLGGEPTDTQHEVFFAGAAYRRKIGVYDAQGPLAALPVATFASWVGELTLPGGTIPACAISAVTVAPTHRRRGILRSVMAGELRAAADLGVPIAALTVSESTIYGRFGFGAAIPATTWEIDTRRAGWVGPTAPGRFDFVGREAGRDLAQTLHERIRLTSPGELALPPGHVDRFFGTRADAEKADQLRVVQYRAVGGDVDGLVVYRISENHDDFTASSLEVSFLLAATDEAYAALWQFLLSMDLIGTVRASELALDEPLWWLIADQRAAKITVRDHHYLRILDVPAVLSARRYAGPETIALEVTDPLGFADGMFLLTIDDDGQGSVDPVDGPPLGIPSVRLGVAELSVLVAGGVSAVTLARAGRLETDDPERIAAVFQTPAAPRLSFWY